MLTEVCNYVHNYFDYRVYSGTFEIVNGGINLEGLVLNGQRFRIVGSALNDGIYTYQSGGVVYNDDGDTGVNLYSEVFTGSIIAMAVPTSFLQIVKDISDWYIKNLETIQSPYTSESFGGYSYTKATGSGANNGGVIGWQDVFKSKLNAYRKIA